MRRLPPPAPQVVVVADQAASSEPEEDLPVAAMQAGRAGELAVADDDHAAVVVGADEPADGLAQLHRGERQVVVLDRVPVGVGVAGFLGSPRGRSRAVRR